jgi:ankyrin repeat protein
MQLKLVVQFSVLYVLTFGFPLLSSLERNVGIELSPILRVIHPVTVEKSFSENINDTGENLIKAASDGDIVTVQAELDRGVSPSIGKNEPLKVAAYNGHLDVVRLLLSEQYISRGVDPAANGNEVLDLAAWNGHTRIIQLLLEPQYIARGVKLADHNSKHLLESSVWNGHTETARFLLQPKFIKRGVDPSNNRNYALKLAVKKKRIKTVNMLLEDQFRYLGVDPSDNNNEALKLAVANGDIDTVAVLLADSRVWPTDADVRYAKYNYNRYEIADLMKKSPRYRHDGAPSYILAWNWLKKWEYFIQKSFFHAFPWDTAGGLMPSDADSRRILVYGKET